jgi:hypothetical protein
MYKILYLPTAEYVVINTEYKARVIRYRCHEQRGQNISLSAPRSLIMESRLNGYRELGDDEDNYEYRIAFFRTRIIAETWLLELIERHACKKYRLKREHFELIRV